MMFTRTLAASALAIGLTASLAQAETTWIMATGFPEDSFFTKNVRMFIEEVETASKGELKIDLRPNGELIKLDAVKRAVQSGQIQIGELRFGVYGNESPMYTLDSLPNVAPDYASGWKLMEAQKPWFDKVFGDAGMQVISYSVWPGQGFYTRFPVESLDQFKGVKMRIYSTATQRMGELLGFEATILPFAEVPQAFSTGLIESLFTSAQTGVDVQAWDYVKHFTYTGSMHNKNGIIVNSRALSALPEDVQKAVVEAGARATERVWKMSAEAGDASRAKLIENGITAVDASPELQAAMADIGAKMMEEWSASVGPEELEILKAYQAAK